MKSERKRGDKKRSKIRSCVHDLVFKRVYSSSATADDASCITMICGCFHLTEAKKEIDFIRFTSLADGS